MCCCHMALCRVESAVQLALSPHNPGDLGWEPRSAQGQVRNAAVCSPVQMKLAEPAFFPLPRCLSRELCALWGKTSPDTGGAAAGRRSLRGPRRALQTANIPPRLRSEALVLGEKNRCPHVPAPQHGNEPWPSVVSSTVSPQILCSPRAGPSLSCLSLALGSFLYLL